MSSLHDTSHSTMPQFRTTSVTISATSTFDAAIEVLLSTYTLNCPKCLIGLSWIFEGVVMPQFFADYETNYTAPNDTATAVDQLRSRLQARQQGEAASVAVTLICSCADIRAASDSKDLLEETTMVLRSLRDPELTNPIQLTSTKDQKNLEEEHSRHNYMKQYELYQLIKHNESEIEKLQVLLRPLPDVIRPATGLLKDLRSHIVTLEKECTELMDWLDLEGTEKWKNSGDSALWRDQVMCHIWRCFHEKYGKVKSLLAIIQTIDVMERIRDDMTERKSATKEKDKETTQAAVEAAKPATSAYDSSLLPCAQNFLENTTNAEPQSPAFKDRKRFLEELLQEYTSPAAVEMLNEMNLAEPTLQHSEPSISSDNQMTEDGDSTIGSNNETTEDVPTAQESQGNQAVPPGGEGENN
jgi:hypothetical protein